MINELPIEGYLKNDITSPQMIYNGSGSELFNTITQGQSIFDYTPTRGGGFAINMPDGTIISSWQSSTWENGMKLNTYSIGINTGFMFYTIRSPYYGPGF